MQGLARAILLLAIGAVAWVGWLAISAMDRSAERGRDPNDNASASDARRAADSAFADSVLVMAGPQNAEVSLEPSRLAPPERDVARIAWALSTRSGGGYLGEMLAAHDSMNFRWPDRSASPMRVWVQELPADTPGWDAAYPRLVRAAFSTWADAGVPIHFSFTPDSARGEIRVTWTDRFEAEVTGRTRWVHDQHRWIVGGSILLAMHHPQGQPIGRDAVRAIALHEVGHLIGLDHTTDQSSIMSARVQVSELSEADRSTIRLVYSLPPGSLRAPR